VWLTFRDGTDTTALLPRATEQGVAFVPGRAFGDAPEYANAARLCFASSSEPVLREAVERLKRAHVLA
jgi:2-aminoadipate transaminase